MTERQRAATKQPEFDPISLQMDLEGFANILETLGGSPSVIEAEEFKALGNALRGIMLVNGLDRAAEEADLPPNRDDWFKTVGRSRPIALFVWHRRPVERQICGARRQYLDLPGSLGTAENQPIFSSSV